jgi:hypothetical protein
MPCTPRAPRSLLLTSALTALVLAGALAPVGCASREPNVKEVDTKLDSKGSTGTAVVGIDNKGDAILQEEKALSAEIRVALHVNENLRMNVRTEEHHLKSCWKSRARATTGEMPQLTDFDDAEAPAGTEEVGLVGGDIKVVRKEDAVARLKTERRRQDALRAHLNNVKKQREKCEFEAIRDTRPADDDEG